MAHDQPGAGSSGRQSAAEPNGGTRCSDLTRATDMAQSIGPMPSSPRQVPKAVPHKAGFGLSAEGSCELLGELARMKHYVLFIDRRCCLFAAQRTRSPFDELDEIGTCFGQIDNILKRIPRKRYRLLVDARCGPLRNDPAFESALSQHRGKLLFGFAKNAALAATASGCLQIQRFARIDGRQVLATEDPHAAFRHLGIPYHHLEPFAVPEAGSEPDQGTSTP